MIPLMKSAFLNEFETKQALADFILRSGKLSMGEQCAEFEKAFAHHQHRSFAVLYNSGASANLALIQAILNLGRLHRGDAVGYSALTWSTNVMPIIQTGLRPVAIDVEPATLNTTSIQLEERLEKVQLQALFITNALGWCGDLEAIRQICHARSIVLLEDNCEALGTELISGHMTGNFGLASTFSFFVAHHMSTIEGGMVCTDDAELAEMLIIVRANGWDRNLTAAQQTKWRGLHGIASEFDAKYSFYDLGYNLRPTEITGFLGLNQLALLENNIQVRERNYLQVEQVAKQNLDLLPLRRDHIRRLSPFATPILCRTPALREHYLREFAGAGIEIRPMIAGNLQRQPFYRKYCTTDFALPGADFVHECGFYCGNYPELTASDMETIVGCITPKSSLSAG